MTIKTFIENLHANKADAIAHQRFIRFGQGDYEREAVLIKATSKNIQVQTGFEFATDIFFLASEMLAHKNPTLKGDAILVNSDKKLAAMIEPLGFTIKAQRGKKYTLTFEMSAKDFAKAVSSLTNYIFLAKFKVEGLELKMKMSPPKPGSIAEKFITLKVDNEYKDALLKTFLFDVDPSTLKKKAEIKHTFTITGVEIPKEYQNDFAAARLHAIRKGSIKRVVHIDGNEVKNYSFDFSA